MATGRSDEPNQISNVLAFPGLFRGLLDGGGENLTLAAQRAAAEAIADQVPGDALTAERIVPDVFDEDLVPAVARAVASALASGEPPDGGVAGRRDHLVR